MDDIQKRADNQAWDQKVNRRISGINHAIEKGLGGEALAALHGLRMAPNDDPPYDVDESTEVDDQETLRNKIISRTIQIENVISSNRDLPDDVKGKWTAHAARVLFKRRKERLAVARSETGCNSWREIDPQSELSLLEGAIDAVATMIEIYRRRFYS